MIRLLLHSRDATLQVLLQPALGPEFPLTVEASRDRVKELVLGRLCDVLILDLTPEDAEEELNFFDEIRTSAVPVVVMTDDDSRETAMELVERGVHNYFRKPPALSELKIAVRRASEYGSLRRDLEQISSQLKLPTPGCDQMIGSSSRLQHVYEMIHRVAPLDASVLITGESGTGKELIARALHNLSPRRQFPFVAVSCGAIPDTLIESELFGSEKGAYTGASGNRRGFMEQAGRGTLFLDEIGELTPHTQVKLLRVVQELHFTRLGSSVLVPLHARLLFATHRNLAQMVEAGEFRLDLYYRINVMGIKAPALRDHTEDIPALARHFLTRYGARYRKTVTTIMPNAMALLVDYLWPGNVRELENVIQKAIVLTDDETIGPEHLPDDLQQPDLLGVGDSLPASSFDDQLHNYKIQIVQQAIKDCKGNKTLAARSLDISRTYLHHLIKGPSELEDGISAASGGLRLAGPLLHQSD
ncbi:MAG: sigma-54 dependent transcriptional regulator [Bryobacteraceae bacterium]